MVYLFVGVYTLPSSASLVLTLTIPIPINLFCIQVGHSYTCMVGALQNDVEYINGVYGEDGEDGDEAGKEAGKEVDTGLNREGDEKEGTGTDTATATATDVGVADGGGGEGGEGVETVQMVQLSLGQIVRDIRARR
jgi:hypothetical protein